MSDGSGKSHTIFRLVLLLCLLVAVGFAINSARLMLVANANKQLTEEAVVRGTGLIDATPKTLAPGFTDSQGRLLADPPASAVQMVDPPVLVVAHLVSSDAESPSVDWDKFEAHLADVTGRKVEDMIFDNGPDQLAQIKAGKITIVALHPADAPFLVNNYGYEPAAVLGDEGGANGNHLDIVVPAMSPINQLSDLKGHTLVCTVPSSITGYRAAVALLMENQSLRPNIDYFMTWSLGQKRSIEGIAHKEFEAAAISDDKLQSLLQSGDVVPADYRIIYQSAVIPRTTIGWFFNLNPVLAEKVKDAILSFQPTALTEAKSSKANKANGEATDAADATDAAAGGTAAVGPPLHFIPIDYNKDFAVVREIDDRFDPRLDAKAKPKAMATTQPDVAAN